MDANKAEKTSLFSFSNKYSHKEWVCINLKLKIETNLLTCVLLNRPIFIILLDYFNLKITIWIVIETVD